MMEGGLACFVPYAGADGNRLCPQFSGFGLTGALCCCRMSYNYRFRV